MANPAVVISLMTIAALVHMSYTHRTAAVFTLFTIIVFVELMGGNMIFGIQSEISNYMSILGLINFYLYLMAFFYSPVMPEADEDPTIDRERAYNAANMNETSS